MHFSKDSSNHFHRRILLSKYVFFIGKNFKEIFKIANQQPTQQSPPVTTSLESPATPTSSQTNHPQSSTRISFRQNPYTFEERLSLISEPLEPVVRHAPLSEPQNEQTYNIYPWLQQDLTRTRHLSQNQNTTPIDGQIIPPPPLQSTSQQNTSNKPSDYLDSTPTSEQIRENTFILPFLTQRLPDWMTQAFTQGEPNLVNGPVEISSETSLSLPGTLSIPSTLQ